MPSVFHRLFLIYFCIHILSLPSIVLAADPTAGSGATIPVVPSSVPQTHPVSAALSEVMWMGSDRSTADEWIEIAGFSADGNAAAPRSLSGWTVTILKGTAESVIARFPSGSQIGSGAYLVISNYPKETSRLANDPFFTSTAMSLPNSKLLLRLRDASGALIDEVDDGVGNPFAGANPPSNGPKASMERIDLRQPGNAVSNWRTATESRGFDPGDPIFGTPGYPNTMEDSLLSSSSQSSFSIPSSSSPSSSLQSSTGSQVSSVASSFSSEKSNTNNLVQPYLMLKINELLSDAIGSDDHEWIELYNAGNDPVNASGMTIRVGTTAHRMHAGSGGIMIAPQGYTVIPKNIAGFSLVNNGATVRLESGSTLVDTFTYPALPEGVSAGRSDTGDVIPFCVPTPGFANTTIAPDPHLVLQSGVPTGEAPVTLNLAVQVASGSLTSSTCHIDYGDGYSIDSCNPASHTIRIKGDYQVNMIFKNYCGTTVTRSLSGTVLAKNYSQHLGTSPKQQVSAACIPSAFSGVAISELLPNPSGNETDGEWIELHNQTAVTKPLCGWALDDGIGGSHPFNLSTYQMTPNAYLLLQRSETKIALNNDHDFVRLIAPLPAGGTGFLTNVQFDHAPQNQSFALNESGSWLWTLFPTPGGANRFQQEASAFLPSPISISAALPNPKGVDTYDEWIELSNSAGWPLWLNGWTIQNEAGKFLDLTGTVLAKIETKRIYLSRLGYTLGNDHDVLSLLDSNHVVRSILSWHNASEDVIEHPFTASGSIEHALVRQIIDGDTVIVQREDSAGTLEHVRLLGIDAPELHDSNPAIVSASINAKEYVRALLLNKKIDLQFDSNKKDKYGRTLAYVFLQDTDIQEELLTHGLAYAYRAFAIGREGEYQVYEKMARTRHVGIWADPALTDYYDQKITEQETWKDLHVHGLSLKTDVPQGLLSSGSLVHFKTNEPAAVYLSVNSSPFQLFSGSYMVAANQTLRAYAEVAFSDADSVKSKIVQDTYIVDASAPRRSIHLSEVYPSPAKGETEWIELFNRSNQIVNVGGWTLDDTASGGSLPWMIPMDVTIPANAYLEFPQSVTKLILNNGGDAVNLFNPSGVLVDHMEYGSTKTGWSIARNEDTNTWCQTQKPTPMAANECVKNNKKSVQKKSIKKGIKTNKKKNKITRYSPHISDPLTDSGVYAGLKVQLLPHNAKKTMYQPIVTIWDITVLALFVSTVATFWFMRRKIGE